jgi:1-acyl-sn-glycerol-3-phosphate acyltransferase
MTFQTLVHISSSVLMHSVARLHVEGRQHAQVRTPLIMCANHLTRWDPPTMYMLRPRGTNIMPVIGEKWRKKWFFRWLFDNMECIWVRPDEIDRDRLKQILTALKAGRSLGVAPEGTRSKTGGLQLAKPGAAWLARASGVPVLPMALWGVESIQPNLKRLRRTDVYIRIGEPFVVSRDLSIEESTLRIMQTIAAMLPESYRGVYAEGLGASASPAQV